MNFKKKTIGGKSPLAGRENKNAMNTGKLY
jgi:hypothetical protein